MFSTIEIPSIVIAILSYFGGFFSGYFFHQKIKSFDERTGETLVLAIVTMIWAISTLVDIASVTYETSPLIHGLMGAIVGYYYKNKNETRGSSSS